MIRTIARSIVVLLLLGPARVTTATTVVVPPGPGTPVQDAIDAAAPGDTIRLTLGFYPEQIVITKALKLRGVRSRSPRPNDTTRVDGGCAATPVITIAADSVQVRGVLVTGDSGGGVDVTGRTRVKLKDVFVASNCAPVTAPAINVEQSTHVTLNHVWSAGEGTRPVGPAGIRIADTPASGRVRLATSIAGGYDVGVLLENDGTASVRISQNYINGSDKGIVLQNTSGAIVDHNRQVFDNTTSGIELDATSTGNLISGNDISGSVTDVVDEGTGNCWRNNTFTTGSVAPCP
jgi:nitrous oxidase accessory protein NosD